MLKLVETPVKETVTQFLQAAAAQAWISLEVRSLSFLSRLFSFLNASAMVMLVGAERSESPVTMSCLVFSSDSSELVNGFWLNVWEHSSRDLIYGCGRLEFLGSRIIDLTLLRLVSNPWPENQLRLIGVKSLHVELKLSLACATSSVINSNSDSSGEAGAQVGRLELL